MCDRIPPPRLPRRTVLAAAGSLLLTACTCARRRRRACRTTWGPPRPAGASPVPPPSLEIVRRAQWGAEPLKDNHDPMARVTRITLHHTAELPNMQSRTDLELVKAVQDFHRNTRGWADIGYHYLVGRDGTVFEGRDLHIQGAHAGGGNNVENLGVSAIGDFSHELPPTGQLEAIERFLRDQQRIHEVANDGLFGHRDFKPTECPGSPLYAWLMKLKAVG